jgi:ankyrin repeat protein
MELLGEAIRGKNSAALITILKDNKQLLNQKSNINNTDESLLDIILYKIVDDDWQQGVEIFLNDINKKLFPDLINRASTINQNTQKKTALHIAISKNNLKIINCLIKHGAAVDITDNINKNAFHYAARVGDIAIFQELEKKVTDRKNLINLLNNRMDFNLNVVDYLVRNNNTELFNYLITKYPKELNFFGKDPKGNNNLHYAADNCNANIFIKLLTFGVDINEENNDGIGKITGYEAAIARYCSAIIEQVDLYQWQHKQTPQYLEIPFLIRAMSNSSNTYSSKHIIFIQTLLKTGVNVNQASENQIFPLHYAAQSGNIELIKIYIARKADVEIKDNKGNTPLLYTAAYGRYEAFSYLIKECNANIYVKNNNEVGIAMRAAGVNSVPMLQLILELDPQLVFYQDKKFATPYHYAAGQNAYEAIIFLAQNTNLGINLKDIQGNTAYTVAMINNAASALDALKTFKADINLKNKYGYNGHESSLTTKYSYYDGFTKLFQHPEYILQYLEYILQYLEYIAKYCSTHFSLFIRLLLDIDKKSYDSTIKLSFQQYSPKMYDNFLVDNAEQKIKLTEGFFLMHNAYMIHENCDAINQYYVEQILSYSILNIHVCLDKKSFENMDFFVEIARMPTLFVYGSYVSNKVEKNLPQDQWVLKELCPPVIFFVIHAAIIKLPSFFNGFFDNELPLLSSIKHLYLHSTVHINEQCDDHPVIYNITNHDLSNTIICEEKSILDVGVEGI